MNVRTSFVFVALYMANNYLTELGYYRYTEDSKCNASPE